MADLGALFAFTGNAVTDGDVDATGLAATTRTTLDNCFVGFNTGFVGLISDFSAAASVSIGFVSMVVGVGDGVVSRILLAFGGSVSIQLISSTKKWKNYKNKQKRPKSVNGVRFYRKQPTQSDRNENGRFSIDANE